MASVWLRLAVVVGVVVGGGWSVEAAECTDPRRCCNLVIPGLNKATTIIDGNTCDQGSSVLSRSLN